MTRVGSQLWHWMIQFAWVRTAFVVPGFPHTVGTEIKATSLQLGGKVRGNRLRTRVVR
jgi:hypothetical protein